MAKSKKQRPKRDIYQEVTDQIIERLEAGTVPWHKPWKGAYSMPKSIASQKEYRGINVFLLGMQSYSSPWWMTYKQATERGGFVKPGQKATTIVFWKRIMIEDKDTGQRKMVPFLRYFSVFNLAQTEDVRLPAGVEDIEPDEATDDNDPIAAAEAVVDAMPLRPKIIHGSNAASYSPSSDYVAMPDRRDFESSEAYYATLFHELVHSTGHESRVGRKLGMQVSFGSEEYSQEELVAEMGASFLGAGIGILPTVIDNSAAYIANWLKVLRGDKMLVVLAAAQAQKATDYILGVTYDDKPNDDD